CGWPGAQPTKKFQRAFTITPLKHGFICVTKHLRATADLTTMGLSIGRISRQSSSTRYEQSLSPMAESRTLDICCHREHLVWLAKTVGSMISSVHEAPILGSCVDACSRYWHPDSHQLFNPGNANF